MKRKSKLIDNIFNEGERLIPGVTHDITELIRHRSSYMFIKKIMDLDLMMGTVSRPVRVVDLGCGVGHGCYTLSEVKGAEIVGVDISLPCMEYARKYYNKSNISYEEMDLTEYITSMVEFDYVVSRGVFEHIPNGLELAFMAKRKYRLIFNVPYDEPKGNPHHVLFGICEEDFKPFSNAELFFEDLEGRTFDMHMKPVKPNMITCVCSKPGLPKVSEMLKFPLPAWTPKTMSLTSDSQNRGIVRKWIREIFKKKTFRDWEGYFK